MTPEQIEQAFSRFQAANPKPQTELHYQTSFELLIAVVLSAQATDVSVNKVTQKLFPVANTPEAIWALGEERLKEYINSIGLFRNKAKHIIKTCQLLVQQYSSTVPHQRAALESLPGVGRKTANVLLNTLFQQPTVAVDTHIFRVANRTQMAPGNTERAVEKKLLARIPEEYLLHAHHWLVLHGRYVCTARSPKCEKCLIADLCPGKNTH